MELASVLFWRRLKVKEERSMIFFSQMGDPKNLLLFKQYCWLPRRATFKSFCGLTATPSSPFLEATESPPGVLTPPTPCSLPFSQDFPLVARLRSLLGYLIAKYSCFATCWIIHYSNHLQLDFPVSQDKVQLQKIAVLH